MELERIGVVLRPRTPREAVDLGVAMLREHAVAVWSAWFAFTLPVAVLCIGVGSLVGLPWLGLLLLWWMLPLFDRLIFIDQHCDHATGDLRRDHHVFGFHVRVVGLCLAAMRQPFPAEQGGDQQRTGDP